MTESDGRYNLLVSFQEGAFESLAYEFERGRFCEYTSPELKERFGPLTQDAIAELKSIPTLFAYEGGRGEARIGYLQRIRERTGISLWSLASILSFRPFLELSSRSLRYGWI